MNLLHDPVLNIRTEEGLDAVSLPELIELLGRDLVFDLSGIQRHQDDAFHIFLCYLAGAVMLNRGCTDPVQYAEFWHTGLLELSDGKDEAWSLVAEDPREPAFLQPPIPPGHNFAAFKPTAYTPDALDLLPTAKNHDVKKSRIEQGTEEDWVFALVSLQTMSGVYGRGNYGISRMNGGYGSRPCVALQYSDSRGGRFKDDVLRLLDLYPDLLSAPFGYRADGVVLTWLKPWDGTTSLSLAELHPFYIEVCRAVRLCRRNGGTVGLSMPTACPRINAKELKGMTGDPWIPVNVQKNSALTVPPGGFSAHLLRNLLFEDGFRLQRMQKPLGRGNMSGCRLTASVLIRGQGKTDGYHSVSIPIPGRVENRLFSNTKEHDLLARLSKTALTLTADVQKRALQPALYAFLEAGPEAINYDKPQISSWIQDSIRGYSEGWSQDFFPWLWRTVDISDERAALHGWERILRRTGEVVLENAFLRFPVRSGRKYRSRVSAARVFYGSLSRILPDSKGGRL